MKKSLVFLSVVFLTIGCTTSEHRSPVLALVSKRIVEIPLDENTSSAWMTLQYWDMGENEYLIFHDRIKSKEKKIHFAHLQDQEKSFQVNVFLDGPNGVGRLDSFVVKNLDSIFVLNQYAYRLFLIDSSGTVKDRYRLIEGANRENAGITYLPFPLPFSPIVDLGDKLVFPARADVKLEDYSYKSNSTAISLDLNSKKFEYELDYPDSYVNSGFWGMHLEQASFAVNFKDSLLVQSFPIEDRVMVYDFDMKLASSPSVFREYYEGKFHSLPEATTEPEVFYPHIYSNPTTKAILFDPYRDVYYRIYSGPYSEQSIERRIKAGFGRPIEDNDFPDLRIMVFDREFNELGVIEVDKEKYWVDFAKVVREGLLLTVKSDDEDKNIFEIFEVKF